MSYSDMLDLLHDPTFTGRVNACGMEQAQIFINDERPEYTGLAKAILQQGSVTSLPANVVARPGMSTDSTDGDILAAVQFVWPLLGAAYVDGSSSA